MFRTSQGIELMLTEPVSTQSMDHLPVELVDFARGEFVRAMAYRGDERRSEGRYPMLVPILAVAMDEDGLPTGPPMDMITRDISATSIGVIHSEPITAERLAIQVRLAGRDVDLIARVVWSRPLGPFFAAAGQYVGRLDRFPVA
jgi:hypothetical protein